MERYRRNELTAGGAAKLAGITKAEFLRRRGEFGVLAIEDRSDEELERELKRALRAAGH